MVASGWWTIRKLHRKQILHFAEEGRSVQDDTSFFPRSQYCDLKFPASLECKAGTVPVEDKRTKNRLAFFGFAEFGDYGEVFEGGGVALDFAVGGQFAEKAAHDFPAAGFGQGLGEADVVGASQRADFF